MKFCAKCGTQIPKETNVCPQCQTPAEPPKLQASQATPTKETPSKKNLSKFNVIIAVILIINVLLSAANTFLIASGSSAGEMSKDSYNSQKSDNSENEKSDESSDETSDDSNNIFTTDITATCPADEYGNHSWQSATCERPSYCWNCGVYKDDKLGNHDFELDEDTGLIECWYCNMLKDDYDKANSN